MELKQHPLSAAFPSMSDEDFEALTWDIEKNGQREPIITLDEMVLDGWHRYRACIELGIDPTRFKFPEGDDPVAFVKSANLHRRHLTGSQRALAMVACSAWVPTGANQHTKRGGEPGSPPAKTNAALAAEAKVSERTIEHAKTAHKAGLGDAVKEGAMTVKEAAQIAKGTPAKPRPDTLDIAAFILEEGAPDQAEFDSVAAAAKAEEMAMRLLLASDEPLADVTAKYQQALLQIEQLSARIVGLQNQSTHQIKTIKSLQAKLKKVEALA
jgi:hypothetical protein